MTSNGRKLSFIVARIICDDDIVAIYQEVHEEGEGKAEAVRGREQNAARNLEGWKGTATQETFRLLTSPGKKRN